MRDLGGQVVDDILAGDEPLHRRRVPHGGGVHGDVRTDLADVRGVAAVAVDQGIAERDAGALGDEAAGETRADEPEPAG